MYLTWSVPVLCTLYFQSEMTSNDGDIHRVFLNKPEELIELLAKSVEIQTQR